MDVVAIPDLAAIVEPILGLSYAEYNCWRLVRFVFQHGWGLLLDDDPSLAMAHVHEIWFRGDGRDPVALVRPWDVLVFCTKGLASDHVGIMFDAMQFLHTRPRGGVCLQPLRRYSPLLLQVARLKQLR